MEVIEEVWEDFCGNETIALSLNKEGLYTVSEFIELLTEAKKKFGNKEMCIHDMNSNIIGGFVIFI